MNFFPNICISRSFVRALAITFVLATTALTSQAQVPAANDPATELSPEQRANATIKLTSPRNTLTTFLAAMNSIEAGKGEYWTPALSCIYLADLTPDDQTDQGKHLARILYGALSKITLQLNSVPDAVEASSAQQGENIAVELGETHKIPLTFNLNSDGYWRFSRTKLVEQEANLIEIAQVSATAAEADAKAQEANISQGVDPRLSNPRNTMHTFLEAFADGYWVNGGRDDALATLDLSNVATNLRLERGEEFAVRLKDILDRDHVVIYEEIAQEFDAPIQVILTDPLDESRKRRIELVPVPIAEGSDAVEWKFSNESLALLNRLWDTHYVNLQPVAAFGSTAPKVLSLQIQDWMNKNAPILMDKLFLIESWKWLGLFFSILLGMIVSRIATAFLIRVVRRAFKNEHLDLDEKLENGFIRPIRVGIMAWVWWLALKPLSLPEAALSPLKVIITTVSCIAFVWAVYRLVDILGTYISEKARLTENKYDDLVVPLIVRTLKLFVLCVGFIFILEMNDQDYRTILAGFGLFGMAMALAAKDTLGNIFGSLTVLMDRPFQIGDWVQMGDVDGNIESVGIRSTRIRTFYNSRVTIPNSTLTNAVIDNYGERQFRRYKATIGITYDTPPDTIDAFCEGIRELIRQHPYTRKDYFHVYLNDFGDSSLNIMLYCFHECPDWSTELRERHRLLNDIIRLAASMGVEFAFPTSTLYMRKDEPGPSLPPVANGTDALTEGRRRASDVIKEQTGGNASVPPPVSFVNPADLQGKMLPTEGDEQ